MSRPVNLGAQATSMAAFNPTKLDRFGGRYRVVFGGLYRVAREAVLALLDIDSAEEIAEHDAELFAEAIARMPPGHEMTAVIRVLGQLAPFRYGTQPEPFDPVGEQARDKLITAWAQTNSLLQYAKTVLRDRQVR
jgi:hypothetical protein